MHTFNFDQLLKHIDDPNVVASHIKQAYHKAANAPPPKTALGTSATQLMPY